jgi:hypothetical protein
VQPITTSNFGFLVAYVLPGYVVLNKLDIAINLAKDGVTIAGVFEFTLFVLIVGMVVSAIRWIVIDPIHHWSGIKARDWCFSKLQTNIDAFELVVRHQYQYYQFHSNMFVGLAIAFGIDLFRSPKVDLVGSVGMLAVLCILFVASRNNLLGYYNRIDQILGEDCLNQSPTSSKKSDNDTLYSLQNSASSTTSIRRSEDSTFETNDA